MTQSTEAGRKFVTFALGVGALELLPQLRPLKSGRMSPYFFNSARFTQGLALTHLGRAYAAAIVSAVDQGLIAKPRVIFGPAYKGITIATATALELVRRSDFSDLEWAHNRKEAKDHGEGGMIVGAKLTRNPVAVTDDVTTTGTSCDEAAKLIREHGGMVIAFFLGFDRMELGWNKDDPTEVRPAAQILRDNYGVPVIASANVLDLITVLEEGPAVPLGAETLPLILEYRDKYGVD